MSVLGKDTFRISVTVSEVEQNRSRELTHPIRRTMSMHIKGSGSEGVGGTTYENVSTYLGLRWQRWKASDISHLLISTGPSFGSASHIFCIRLGRHEPNCIALGLVDESVDSFTEGVVSSDGSEELGISQGFRFGWSMYAKREIRMR